MKRTDSGINTDGSHGIIWLYLYVVSNFLSCTLVTTLHLAELGCHVDDDGEGARARESRQVHILTR